MRRYDIAIIGNGIAAAGVIQRLTALCAQEPHRAPRIIVLEARPSGWEAAQPPEITARVTFPVELGLEGIEELLIATYDKVAFYTPKAQVRKRLPADRVALVDIEGLVRALEAGAPPNISIERGQQAFDARYVEGPWGREIELSVSAPFGDGKRFDSGERVRARVVIDASGAGSLLLDKMQGYRRETDVLCGVLAFKVLGARLSDQGEVSLALDDHITHGAGAWSYPNQRLSPALEAYLDEWFEGSDDPALKAFVQGRSAADLAHTISDVGISSISHYARGQHYRANLERQALDLFENLPAYRAQFRGAFIIPGTILYRPSPVLQPLSQMGGDNYLLVGDAAGQATPYIGEGVRPGLEMGRAAAGVIWEALRAGDLSARRLREPYEAHWWRRFGRFDWASCLFRHLSSKTFSDAQWDTFIDRLNQLSEEEFYRVLKSEYDLKIASKMFSPGLALNYLDDRLRALARFLGGQLTPRQFVAWLK